MVVNGTQVKIVDGAKMSDICDEIVEKSGTYNGRGLSMSFLPEEWNSFSAMFGSQLRFVAALINYIKDVIVRAGCQPAAIGILIDEEGYSIKTI